MAWFGLDGMLTNILIYKRFIRFAMNNSKQMRHFLISLEDVNILGISKIVLFVSLDLCNQKNIQTKK